MPRTKIMDDNTPRHIRLGEHAAALLELRRRGFLIQDLAAVAAGLRPMCRFELLREDARTSELLARFLEAARLTQRRGACPYEARGVLISIGADAARLKAFEDATSRKAAARDLAASRAMTLRQGELLGYPRCCVRAFAGTERGSGRAGGDPVSFPALVRRRSGAGPHPFETNFLYNFHSRGSGASDEFSRLLAGGYRGMELSLLPWIPCRFSCVASVRFGRGLNRVLESFNEGHAAMLRSFLSATMVLRDDWSFVGLAGTPRRYSAVLDVATLMPAGDVELLRRGDSLSRAAGGRWTVRRGGRVQGQLPRGCAVLEFE